MTYCDFVVAKHKSISTEPPLVIRSEGSKNDLNPGSGLVQVRSQLVSLQLLVSSDSPEDDGKSRRSLIAEELVLLDQLW